LETTHESRVIGETGVVMGGVSNPQKEGRRNVFSPFEPEKATGKNGPGGAGLDLFMGAESRRRS